METLNIDIHVELVKYSFFGIACSTAKKNIIHRDARRR